MQNFINFVNKEHILRALHFLCSPEVFQQKFVTNDKFELIAKYLENH
jgi:hypothetical protein